MRISSLTDVPPCPIEAGEPQALRVTLGQARKIARLLGKRQEPYRGYSYALPDGRLLSCPPDGFFYIMPALR